MIAILNLFIIDGISGFVSRVAIIYIGILPLRIQKEVCGTFNKFYLCLKINVSLNVVLHYTFKNPIFKMSGFFVERPAFSEKISCFYNNPYGKSHLTATTQLCFPWMH
jgi:hypothetical protein